MMGSEGLQLPSSWAHSQAPGGGQPGFPPGPGQLSEERCPVDSWLLPQLPSHLFKGGEKGAGPLPPQLLLEIAAGCLG